MIEITDYTKSKLLKLREEKGITLEGNILKLIDAGDDEVFREYIDESIRKDKETRRKRLDITKRIQSQNNELNRSQKENDRVNRQLTKALEEADSSNQKTIKAKDIAIKAKDEAEASKIEAIDQKRKADNARKESEIARVESENAKVVALKDLELEQKKSQFELIGTIVKVALYIILGVGVVTTALYALVLFNGMDATIIGSTWTNIISILLTNSFSIIGTIMGVKYANGKDKKE